MKNTWIQAAESHTISDRLDDEDSRLLYYYFTDHDKLNNRIKEITQATIDEFWRPEAFNSSDEYCQHMMHWKNFISITIPKQTIMKLNDYSEGNLFNFIMLAILNDIEFYNNTYTTLFEEGVIGIKCDCTVCK